MNHITADPLALSRYLDGEAPKDVRDNIESHLGSCQHCLSEVERLRHLDRQIVALRETRAVVPARVEATIFGAIADRKRRLVPRFVRLAQLTPAAVGTSIAAMLVLVSVNFNMHGPGTTSSSSVQTRQRIGATLNRPASERRMVVANDSRGGPGINQAGQSSPNGGSTGSLRRPS